MGCLTATSVIFLTSEAGTVPAPLHEGLLNSSLLGVRQLLVDVSWGLWRVARFVGRERPARRTRDEHTLRCRVLLELRRELACLVALGSAAVGGKDGRHGCDMAVTYTCCR